MEITQFAAHTIERFTLTRSSFGAPTSAPSNRKYLPNFRPLSTSEVLSCDIAIDASTVSMPRSRPKGEQAVAVTNNGSMLPPLSALASIRTHIASADHHRQISSVQLIPCSASRSMLPTRNVVVHLENDDGITEDILPRASDRKSE